MCERERERRVSVCVCVMERERERERKRSLIYNIIMAGIPTIFSIVWSHYVLGNHSLWCL